MLIQILEKWCRENSISISDSQISAFEIYADMLIEWNKKMNLTAITEENEIAVKHFIDSLSVLKYIDIKQNATMIDIGTGAGFPGIPLKIVHPDINLTLLDSLNKRLIFLNEVSRAINIKVDIIHARAEDLSQKPEYREKFDYAVSRAVANLPSLCEYCIPYVKKGGMFISMKGSDGEKELELAKNAVELLGGRSNNIYKFNLPDDSNRTIITISKIGSTPSKYPRRGTKISKNPL